MKSKYYKQAWLLDEDVLLKGMVCKKIFQPDSKYCGFQSQRIRRRDIGVILFYDLNKAKKRTGCSRVIAEYTYSENE